MVRVLCVNFINNICTSTKPRLLFSALWSPILLIHQWTPHFDQNLYWRPAAKQYSTFIEPYVTSDYLHHNHNIIPGCNMSAAHPFWNKPCISSSLWEPWVSQALKCTWKNMQFIIQNYHWHHETQTDCMFFLKYLSLALNSCLCHLCQEMLWLTMQALSVTSI